MTGIRRTLGPRRRTYSAPTPFGPYSLWPESASRSTPAASTSTGTFPTACVASVMMSAPASWAICAISRMGWMTPVSLLPHIAATASVLSVTASRSWSRSTAPARSTGSVVIS